MRSGPSAIPPSFWLDSHPMSSRAPAPQLHYLIEEHRLANGLRLVVNPDAASPGVTVNLWYQVGSRDEAPRRTGFAHLFEHLMFQGTWTGVETGEHLSAIQAAGGTANATTSFDRTNYFETVHPGALELALWLEAQRMEFLKVDQTNLDTQREVVKEEKRQRYDNVPYGDTFQALFELAYPSDHPYGHLPIGSMADLDAAALEDVQAFHATHYSPANAVLVLAGAITTDQAIELTERHFAQIPPVDAPTRVRPGGLDPFEGTPTATLERPVPRDATHLVWRIPTLDDPTTRALDLGLDILTAGQSGRLHRALVMDQELAESVSGATMGLAGETNLAVVSTHTREGRSSEELAEATLEGIRRLGEQGPTEEELQRVHAQLERQVLSDLASASDRADEINHWTSLTGDPQRVNGVLASYAEISGDDIRAAVSTWLSPERHAALNYRKAH